MAHSDDDPSIPIEQVLRMQAALESVRGPYRFVRYRFRGYMFIGKEAIVQSRKFIAFQMAGAGAAWECKFFALQHE